jgi:hypothetical protein
VDAPKSTVESPDVRKLRALEEKFRHELMGEDERLELREAIVRLRRKLGL